MTFKEYYDEYYKDKTVDAEVSALEEELKEWERYRNCIINGTLLADEFNAANEYYQTNEYTGKKNNNFSCSLRQFAENESDNAGYLGMMKSSLFPLWIEKDTHNWKKREKHNGRFVNVNITKDNGIEYFKKELCPYLKELLEKTTIDEVYNHINTKRNISELFPQSFLVKLIVLNCLAKKEYILFGIYKYRNIEEAKEFTCLQSITGDEEEDCCDGDKEDLPAVVALKKGRKAVERFNEIYNEVSGSKISSPESFLRAQECVWYIGNSDYSAIIKEPNVIFYGAPGTGKTFTVKKALYNVPPDQILFVQFHPGFSYEDFIEGIKPTGIDEHGNLKFEIINGVFKDFCIKARDNSEKEYYFVADEINRANLSAVFGEVLSLLERDYRFDPNDRSKWKTCLRSTPLSKAIESLQDEKEKLAFIIDVNGKVLFGIPKNIHFIGMMNDVDKSIDTFDLALRRRFVWIRKDFDAKALREILHEKRYLVKNEVLKQYIKDCETLNSFISGCEPRNGKVPEGALNLGKSFEFGHAFYKDVNVSNNGKISKNAKEELFDNHLAPTLREYCRSFFNETEIDKKISKAKNVFVGE